MEEKNYYDWLEVSPKASPEVIEKAYKALVLKYHPDVSNSNSIDSEEIIKKINEAYEVLSDKIKRKEYDKKIDKSNVTFQQQQTTQTNPQPQYDQHVQQNHQKYQQQKNETIQKEHELKAKYEKEIENARRKAYYDAYIKELRNRGFKIRYKKDFKYYLKLSIIIIVLISICFIIWHIPFTRRWIINSINNNEYSKIFFGWMLPKN